MRETDFSHPRRAMSTSASHGHTSGESAASAPLSKAERKLRAACLELITTEESYVETLRAIVTVFMRPLRTWATEEGDAAAAARSGGVTTDEISILFGLVDTLLEVNSGMLEQLKQGEAAPEPARLAMTMATWAAGPLRMYAPHVSRFPAVCALLARLLDRRTRFKAAVRVLELQPAAKGLTLQALLVNTVQRLPRYTLLLKEILTHATAETLGHSVNAVRDKLHLVRARDPALELPRSSQREAAALSPSQRPERPRFDALRACAGPRQD